MSEPTWRVIRCEAGNRPHSKSRMCDGCGRKLTPSPPDPWRRTPIVVTEQEVDIFRGNDVVKFYHPGCEPGGASHA